MNEKVQRTSWIDSLKGIAICGVVMIHTGGGSLPGILGRIGNAGKYGVQLFLVISGYLAYVSLTDFYASSKNTDISYRKSISWWMKKIINLAPLYYFSILASLVIEGTRGRYFLGEGRNVTGMNILSHVFFLHGINPYYINSIIGGEWYLAILALFYVFVPCLYRHINSLKRVCALFLMSIFVSFIVCHFAIGLNVNVEGYIWSAYIWNFGFLTQFPVLILGILLYFVNKSSFIEGQVGNKTLSLFLLFISFGIIITQIYEVNILPQELCFVTWGISFCGIVISQVICRCIIIDNALFKSIGKLSYPIYLIHLRIITLFERYIQKGESYNVIMWMVKYVGIMLISCLIAKLLVVYIDKPIKKVIGRKAL